MATRDRYAAEIDVAGPVSAAQSPPRQVARVGQPGAGREGATPVPIEGVSACLPAWMNESLGVPTATTFREIDVATLEAERSRLNASRPLGHDAVPSGTRHRFGTIGRFLRAFPYRDQHPR